MIPRLWLALAAAGTLAASLAAAYGIGYTQGAGSKQAEISALTSVSEALSGRNRQITQEVRDAQQGHLAAWTTERKRADDYWLRLKTTSRDRVPVVCAEPAGVGPDPGHGMEASSAAGDRDLLPTLVDALEAGERLEATLQLCQAELRQCAALR